MKRPVRIAVVLALAALAPLPVAAQQKSMPSVRSSFPIFFDFFGTWRGEGTVGGAPAKVEMIWAPIVDGHFVRVTWKNTMTPSSGQEMRYEGEGTYRPVADADNYHVGTWFDSQSLTYRLYGRVAGDSLTTTWGQEGALQGRTTYRLLDHKTMQVHEEVKRGDAWVTFGLSTLTRQPVAPAAAPPTD